MSTVLPAQIPPSARTLFLVRMRVFCTVVAVALGLVFFVRLTLPAAIFDPSISRIVSPLLFPGLPIAAIAQQMARVAMLYSYLGDRSEAGVLIKMNERVQVYGWTILIVLFSITLMAFMYELRVLALGAAVAAIVLVCLMLAAPFALRRMGLVG